MKKQDSHNLTPSQLKMGGMTKPLCLDGARQMDEQWAGVCHLSLHDAALESVRSRRNFEADKTRQFANSFPGAARRDVKPCAESAIWAFYGCPMPAVQGPSRLLEACMSKETCISSCAKRSSTASSIVSRVLACSDPDRLCLDGMCIDGEAVPRSLSARLDSSHSQRVCAADYCSLLAMRLDWMVARASGNGRLAQAACELIARHSTGCERERHVVVLTDS